MISDSRMKRLRDYLTPILLSKNSPSNPGDVISSVEKILGYNAEKAALLRKSAKSRSEIIASIQSMSIREDMAYAQC